MGKRGFYRIKEIFLLEDGENLKEFKMGAHNRSCNKDVIQVNKNVGKVSKKAIHEVLECLGSVMKTKGHVKVFKEAKRSDYCSFRRAGIANW
jgi:hypothetical protein